MESNRAVIYAALVVAASSLYGLMVGRFWVTDIVILTAVAGGVCWLCFRNPNRSADSAGMPLEKPVVEQILPRSRIAHYVNMSRIRPGRNFVEESDSPFERALLRLSDWKELSYERLRDVIWTTPTPSA